MSLAAISSAYRPAYYPAYPSYPAPYHPGNPGYGYGNPYGTDTFTSVTSLVAGAGGGGFASYKLSARMAENYQGLFGNGLGGFFGGMKQVALTGFKGAGLSALVGAGVSVIGNGFSAATGRIEASEATRNVVSDTITSAVGGFGAVTLGGLGHILLGKLGLAGTGLTIATVALGAVGGVAAAQVKNSLMSNPPY
ncbi:MAG: hypothetical protein CVV27_09775 [Candidatus Melainabacteria bacterium HGW-Melainabacteria-1]|nr:MAG: hypothetical protein CVV27_09775 [Candidatus Melainabacteria bacterium HGW-Melainabacteria-1]